ncbi:nuclear transport factor 2 family protein [uncultured Methanobacterium sp.]|uniref:nuclear transport factor 2 family protein n=1 Tax=uncultured Methanobacterium sp. TaxID=176306 RepID=UPI002AA675DD|nr:nuclear transport factor 2 family protein [uncultured Methanobacterium sp.]
MMNIERVENLFKNLENGNSDNFFEHVSDDVSWTVMGTHPLAGTYHSKEDFISHTFRRLNRILEEGVILKVKNVLLHDDTAVVEMESISTALNGKPFNNTYCWVVYFKKEVIVEVRAYVDSALVQKVIDENEK